MPAGMGGKCSDGFFGGAHAAVIGAMGGGEIERVRRFTGKEQAPLERPRQHRPRPGLARQGIAIGTADIGGTGPVGRDERAQVV